MVASAERWTGWGRGGRADSASMTGMRATARAGHQALAVAAPTASTRLVTMTHSGTEKPGMSWPAPACTRDRANAQAAIQAAVPPAAATRPTSAPFTTVTMRT